MSNEAMWDRLVYDPELNYMRSIWDEVMGRPFAGITPFGVALDIRKAELKQMLKEKGVDIDAIPREELEPYRDWLEREWERVIAEVGDVRVEDYIPNTKDEYAE